MVVEADVGTVVGGVDFAKLDFDFLFADWKPDQELLGFDFTAG